MKLASLRRPPNVVAALVVMTVLLGGAWVAVGRGSVPDLPTVEVARGVFTDLLEIRGEIRPLKSVVGGGRSDPP